MYTHVLQSLLNQLFLICSAGFSNFHYKKETWNNKVFFFVRMLTYSTDN